MDHNLLNDTKFQVAIAERVKAGDGFMCLLNEVCGVVSSYLMSADGFNLGGFDLEHIKSGYTPFELACFEAIKKFEGEPSYFRYAFMDAWVIVCGFNKVGDTLESTKFDPRAGSHLWVAYKHEHWPKIGQGWYCTQFGEAVFQIQNYILRWSDLSEKFFSLLGRQDVLPYQSVFQVGEEALIEFSACVRRESLKNWQVSRFHQNEASPFPKVTTFKECDTCAAKPGSPILCKECLTRRSVFEA